MRINEQFGPSNNEAMCRQKSVHQPVSVTSRVRNAMVGLAVALCLLFTGLIFLLVYIIEDQVFVNQLKAEQEMFERLFDNGSEQIIQNWRPGNGNIRLIHVANDLPESIPNLARKQIVAEHGVHEYFDNDHALFIAHRNRPDTNAPYYLVYDVKNLLAVRNSKQKLLVLIGTLTLFITAVAVVMARRLTKSTLAPVSHLSAALKNNDFDEVVIELANEFSADEIGSLAHELALALERVRESARREYEINRGMSHELRSPIQAAQSAVELLQLYSTQERADTHPQLVKPISRLQRSVTEMNEIAEAFLWLASDRVLQPDDMCSVDSLQTMLNTVQSAIPGIAIELSQGPASDHLFPMPSTCLAVVLRSLIRNAVMHGEQTTIVVAIEEQSISVSNSMNLEAHESNSFGVGLSIVQRICDRFACTLKASPEGDQQFCATLLFDRLCSKRD
ncbi:MAG: sensor histidine kinase [Pseudomonadales bacterium]